MLTWICIGIAVEVAWLIVQFTRLKMVTVHEFFEILKEYKWTIPLGLVTIAINILIWPISFVVNLYTIYKLSKEKEEERL